MSILQAARLAIEHIDGALTNVLSGLGTSADKSTHTQVKLEKLLSAHELGALYEGNDIARHIAEDLPEDCTRRWCRIRVSQADYDEELDPFREAFGLLRVREAMRSAHTWARVYGGGGLVLGLDDAGEPEEPVRPDALRGIKWIRVATADELRVIRYVDDPMSADLGRPEIYQYTPADGTAGATRIHHTRVIRFEGRLATPLRKSQLDGWGISSLQTAWDAIQRYTMVEHGIAHGVHEYSIGVLRVKDLAKVVTSANKSAFIQRMADLNLSKSMTRMLIVDQDGETYERHTMSMAGLADAHDRFARSLCVAADMPATRLFGDAPGGLSTDNEAGRENWHARVEAAQTHVYTPAIMRIVELMRLSGMVQLPEDATVEVVWAPLSDVSPKTQAETEKLQAETDEAYWRMGSIDEMEIRYSRFGGSTGSIRLMDAQERQRALAETGELGPAAARPVALGAANSTGTPPAG